MKKENRDRYYSSIMKPIQKKCIDLVYEKVCAEIIIPKLKTLSKKEQYTYLYDVLNSVKDEPNVLKTLSNAIVKYANMSDKELQKAIEVTKGENVKFQDLKNIYQKFQVDYKDDDRTQLYVKDRKTGKEITDPKIVRIAKFASIWSVAAGSKWVSGEELPGITYAFNESSERIYNKLGELVHKCMAENGMIDTQAIYDELSKDGYKHSEEIMRTLLINQENMSIVYDFFKVQNDGAKMETQLAKSSNEFIFELTGESIVQSEVETIMQYIPDFASKDGRKNAQEQTMGIAQVKQSINRSQITSTEFEKSQQEIAKRKKLKHKYQTNTNQQMQSESDLFIPR